MQRAFILVGAMLLLHQRFTVQHSGTDGGVENVREGKSMNPLQIFMETHG
jgi:hypothetical protein